MGWATHVSRVTAQNPSDDLCCWTGARRRVDAAPPDAPQIVLVTFTRIRSGLGRNEGFDSELKRRCQDSRAPVRARVPARGVGLLSGRACLRVFWGVFVFEMSEIFELGGSQSFHRAAARLVAPVVLRIAPGSETASF